MSHNYARVIANLMQLSDTVSSLNDPFVIASIKKLDDKDLNIISNTIEKINKSLLDFRAYMDKNPFMGGYKDNELF